ncbi:unnamed protein product [Lactuca virosa]|uniref:Microsomal glutathione S-transferase 3 n=1 Tax=Lactuca virosa TaxID=75947 RepID=A0AAU9M9A1_9ASTR|nr:unnamed protein product [Lactuca virosa]
MQPRERNIHQKSSIASISALVLHLYRYNVSYPALYATEGDTKDYKLFNCIQRGHQNSLESLPILFVLMVLEGFKHPFIFSALGLAYTVTRFFYFKGYSSGDPKGRLPIGGCYGLEEAINCDPN